MNSAVILLGTNMGDKMQNLRSALAQISESGGKIERLSDVYETEPWGNPDQPVYYNQVAEIMFKGNAAMLLDILLKIEANLGRERRKKWEQRIIDLDIIYFNDEIIDQPGLTVPHPHMHERRFALAPLSEILPQRIHPVFQKSTTELLDDLSDDLKVSRLQKNMQYFE